MFKDPINSNLYKYLIGLKEVFIWYSLKRGEG